CWLTNIYMPIIPKAIPIIELVFILLLSIKRISNSTNNGCVEASKAAKPLSTYFSDQTNTPFPYTRNKNPATTQFISCFRLIAKLSFIDLAMAKIIMPAVTNRKDAKKNGGSSPTAILLSRYVEPQITYIAKKAKTMKMVLRGIAIML